MPPNRIAPNPAPRFRRSCPVHQALRNSPESRARLLMAPAPLPRLFQNTMGGIRRARILTKEQIDMTTPRVWSPLVLALAAAAWPADPRTPALTNTCLITKDVKRLVDFYGPILSLKSQTVDPASETTPSFPPAQGVLMIFSAESAGRLYPRLAESRRNEQKCDPGIQSCRRRSGIPPPSEPRENLGQAAHHAAHGEPAFRSIFGDPDGNLVNFIHRPPQQNEAP